MKVKEFLQVFGKLEMKIKDGRKHTIAEFWSDDRLVVWTKLSHGSGELKGNLRHLIRQQMQLNDEELRLVKSCTYGRDDYIRILKKKRFL